MFENHDNIRSLPHSEIPEVRACQGPRKLHEIQIEKQLLAPHLQKKKKAINEKITKV